MMADIMWLPGVGATKQEPGAVKCGIIMMGQSDYLKSWTVLFNNVTGIFRSTLSFDNGSQYTFGLPGGTPPTGSAHFNMTFYYDPSKGLVEGLWGYQQDNVIKALSPVFYNVTKCPIDETTQPEVEEEDPPVVEPVNNQTNNENSTVSNNSTDNQTSDSNQTAASTNETECDSRIPGEN